MPPILAPPSFKSACALLDAGLERGTGFLVRPDAVLTCGHVVRRAAGLVRVRFEHGEYEAQVAQADFDNDLALLRLSRPVRHVQPLPLASAPPRQGQTWESYGFPAATLESGLLIAGDIQDPEGMDSKRRPAVQLYSRHLTAGAYPQGMSGSPVICQGAVIGQLRQIIPDGNGGAQFGTLYATPSHVLARLLPDKAPARSNPYRGLSAFQVNEAHLFFGRADLTEKLWQHYRATYEDPSAVRLLAILGPSGSGKSSVARAGLLALLGTRPIPGTESMRTVVFRPGAHPIRALALALHSLIAPTPDLDAQRKLAFALGQANERGELNGLTLFAANLSGIDVCPLVLLVDQLEEIYTLCTEKAERDAFVGLLLHAARDGDRQASLLLTLRSDFLGETQREHPELNRLIGERPVLVTAMSPDELRQAIAQPAAQAGQPLDEATIALLLAEASGSEGALPLLEFALAAIWEGMQAGKEPAVTLREMGGVGGALAGKAQAVYDALSAAEQATARRAFIRLVRIDEGARDTRRRVPVRELCGRGQRESDVLAVLRKFTSGSARLVTLSGEGDDILAEVTHETLFQHWLALGAWIDESRADRRLHDRAAEAARLWADDQRRPGRLWRRPDLDLLREYSQRQPDELTPLQIEFLQASETRRQHHIARRRQRRHEIEQQQLDTFVEHGRHLLFDKDNPIEAILWLHRAQARGSMNPLLPDLLRSARYGVEATERVLVGHTAAVLDAAYSPDGEHVVTASRDKTARVWHARTGRVVTVLSGHTASVWTAAYAPDGTRIVTAGADKTARVFDARSGLLLLTLRGHTDSIYCASYGPDGARIVTASDDKTARIWDAETGQLCTELTGHGAGVLSASYSPDGRYIVTAGIDKAARIWEAETGRPVHTLEGHEDVVWCAAYSPDGARIVTGSSDQTARLWDAESGRMLEEISRGSGSVRTARYSPDGRRILTAGVDPTLRVFHAETRRLLGELKGHEAGVHGAAYRPDGQRIVTASEDETARIWSVEDGRRVAALSGHGASVRTARYSPDGRCILTASKDHTARIWSADTGASICVLAGHSALVTSAAYSPDGRCVVIASEDPTARVWDAATGRLLVELAGHGARVDDACYSPDGLRIITTSDRTVRVWDAATGNPTAVVLKHEAPLCSAAYSPDGRRIVTASLDHRAQLWEAEGGRLLLELKGHGASARTAMYSPDGRQVLTSSDDRTARVWDAETGRPLAVLRGHRASVGSAAYSPDGRRIVTASSDCTARIWDAASGLLLAELWGHTARVRSAAYSPDGRRIVTASSDQTAVVWDAAPETQSAEEIARLIHAKLGLRFAGEDSNRIVQTLPQAAES